MSLTPSLQDLQSSLRDTILGASAEALNGIVADDRLGYAKRINVYRNNTQILLIDALATNFPVVAALVGEDFFANMARAFVRTHPPQSPCLFEYGDVFAAFIETFPGVQELPYLADVARLEWAQVEVFHAADAHVLDAAHLSDIHADEYGRLTLAVHPAMRIVSSPFPIFAIWDLHQSGPDATVDLGLGGEAVLITRPGIGVNLTVLSPGEDAFILDLVDGETLGNAFARAQDCCDGFDATHALSLLLTQNAFSAHALIHI